MSHSNPFDPIYKIMNTVDPAVKLADMPPFPRLMDIELTNTCNFRCLMCPVGIGTQKRPKGIMSEEVFASVLDQAAAYGCALRFILWGEPTLHPRWLEYLGRVAASGLSVHFNTNGSRIEAEDMRELVRLGVHSVKFSFQGVDRKSYREMRNTDYFEELLAKVELLHGIRGDAPFPFIHISTTITYETAEQVAAFRQRAERFTDKVTVGRTELDRFDASTAKLNEEETKVLEHMRSEDLLVRKHPRCAEVFDKLSVFWDGRVSVCCRDFESIMQVGDVREQTLAEIWSSQRAKAYRKALAQGEYDKFPLCSRCWDYYGLQTPGLQGVM